MSEQERLKKITELKEKRKTTHEYNERQKIGRRIYCLKNYEKVNKIKLKYAKLKQQNDVLKKYNTNAMENKLTLGEIIREYKKSDNQEKQ